MKTYARHITRVPVQLPALVISDEGWSAVTVHNLSVGGAMIQTALPIIPGEEFYLRLSLPEDWQPTYLLCRVIWTRLVTGENGKLRFGGVEFQELSAVSCARVGEFLVKMLRSRIPFPVENPVPDEVVA